MLEPLAELAPELDVPGRGQVSALLAELQSPRVSHLDELDEYEAELELRLKKEYSAVYSLFRYCVLTQDAHLPLQQARPAVRAAAVVPVLPAEDGGRLGLGQDRGRRG